MIQNFRNRRSVQKYAHNAGSKVLKVYIKVRSVQNRFLFVSQKLKERAQILLQSNTCINSVWYKHVFFSIVGHLIEERDQITFKLCLKCMVENQTINCSYQSCEQKLSLYYCSEVNTIASFPAIVYGGIKRDILQFQKEPKDISFIFILVAILQGL